MADEQESHEQSKGLTHDRINEIEQSLLKAKQDVASKLNEIDIALAQLKQPTASNPETNKFSTNGDKPASPAPDVVGKDSSKQGNESKKKPEVKNDYLEKKLQAKDLEKQQLALLTKSINNRTKGTHPAEKGNTGMKHTKAEIFVYVIDDNPLQLKILLEKFKTTKSFKIVKGFTGGEECLQYIQSHKYPKNSMIMVIVDFYLDDSNREEAENGIDVLNRLKDYDPDIDVIVLSSSDDVDIAASATHFGAVSFVKKGEDDFKKIVNNMVWAIHDKAKLRKKLETKVMIKNIIIGMIVTFIIIIIAFETNEFIKDRQAKQQELQQLQLQKQAQQYKQK